MGGSHECDCTEFTPASQPASEPREEVSAMQKECRHTFEFRRGKIAICPVCKTTNEMVRDYHAATAKPAGERSYAPWNERQVNNLREFQECGWVHPFTCCGESMEPGIYGFYCGKCDRLQNWCHDFMLTGAPPNPLKFLEQFHPAEEGRKVETPRTDGNLTEDEKTRLYLETLADFSKQLLANGLCQCEPRYMSEFLTEVAKELAAAKEELKKANRELKELRYSDGIVCEVCNWTNTGCLRVGSDDSKDADPKWMCHGCLNRAINERDDLKQSNTALVERLGRMRDLFSTHEQPPIWRIKELIEEALAAQGEVVKP